MDAAGVLARSVDEARGWYGCSEPYIAYQSAGHTTINMDVADRLLKQAAELLKEKLV